MEPRARINIAKSADNIVNQNKDFMKMKDSLESICKKLTLTNERFQKEELIQDLARYIKEHDRIIYSVISNRIYAYYDEYGPLGASEIIGQIIHNIETLIDYTKDDEYKRKFGSGNDYKHISKVLVKIWDHVNLAVQQYTMLRMSDDEYNKKIDEKLNPFKNELFKDMNAQLLTMLGIFTALAFLLFGGISSLENLFANSSMPLLKFIVVGTIWSFCLLNMIFIFLFCIGKMANFEAFSSDNKLNCFQRYSIIWVCDYILIAIMVASSWLYYLQCNDGFWWIDSFVLQNPVIITAIVMVVIIAPVAAVLYKTKKKK